jgi:hypothetical protein
LGFGVNPSPVPDPQSFQKLASLKRRIDSRASPIITNAQRRAGVDWNLKKLSVTA